MHKFFVALIQQKVVEVLLIYVQLPESFSHIQFLRKDAAFFKIFAIFLANR
jgi:hypothetical protein